MASILLVEDDDELRSLLKELLTSSGYEVLETSNGTRACEVYQRDRFDLVITDVVMPDIDGLEVIMELQRLDKNVGIIAISGAGQDKGKDYLRIAKKLGAQFTLSKPFTNADFLDAVSLTLENLAKRPPPDDSVHT